MSPILCLLAEPCRRYIMDGLRFPRLLEFHRGYSPPRITAKNLVWVSPEWVSFLY
jgi:hypothetical protein